MIERTRSIVRFMKREDRDSRRAGSPISGRPSAVWMPTFVPITSKKRGTRSIWMSRSFMRADEVEHLLVRVVREGDDDSLDVEDLHHLRKLLEAAEDGDIRQTVPARLGLSVHESDEVEAVLRVLAELLRDELARRRRPRR